MIIQKTAWCGFDLSKNTFDAAYHPGYKPVELSLLPTKSFPRTRSGMQACSQWIQAQRTPHDEHIRVVMEATGSYSLETAAWLLADFPEYQPAIVNPRHAAAFHTSLGLANKTDQIDCRALAKMGLERNPQAYQPLSPMRQNLRALTRHRVAIVKECTATKNRCREGTSSAFLQGIQNKHLASLNRSIERMEAQLKRLVVTDPRIKQDMKLLQTIKGVGFFTAITVIAELGDLATFKCARQLTNLVGVSPRNQSSGKSVFKRPRMSKQGNAHVRAVLFMAARTAATHNPQMAALYTRLRTKGKCHKSALGAVMRKLLIFMRAVIIGRNPYDANWDTKTKVTQPVEKLSKNHPKLRFVRK